MKRILFFRNADAGGASGGSGDAGAAAAGGSATLLGVAAGDASASSASQQSAASASQEYSWAKADGTLDPTWIDRLNGDLKGHAALKSINTIPDLAKSYIETKKLMGTKLEMPREGATEEQIAAWRKTVGAPEKPEGYYADGAKSLRPEIVPENLWDVANEKKFLELAHKHHLPASAVKDILGFYGESIKGQLDASQVQLGDVLKTEGLKLRAEFKTDYDANMALAARVARTVGLDPEKDAIFTSAANVIAFAKLGKMFSEDKLIDGQKPSFNGSVAERIRDITDPKSTSNLSRDYRGENGAQRQTEAQAIYHALLKEQQQHK